MGDPKFSRRKYDRPSHPWEGERIKKEKEIVKKYGLKNKKELWKAQSLLRVWRRDASKLNTRLRVKDPQAEKEAKWLVAKLVKLGMLETEASTMDDVLSLTIDDLLSRRLQTVVYTAGMANTVDQARQFIKHRHIAVSGRIIDIPGYKVKKEEESAIGYSTSSPLADKTHPARNSKNPAISSGKVKA